MKPDERAEELLNHGYSEVTQFEQLQVGQRVRHGGEQWPEARRNGTGVIERIFHSPRLIWGKPDVELIVRRDKPRFGPEDTHGYWADYHTSTVRTEAPRPAARERGVEDGYHHRPNPYKKDEAAL